MNPLALSNQERQDLARLEATARKHLCGFAAAAVALLEIRDRGLFRETHADFRTYCRDRFRAWKISNRHVNRLIASLGVYGALGPAGPATERQARELAGVDADLQRRVWQAAVEEFGRHPTAPELRRTLELLEEETELERVRQAEAKALAAPAPRKERTARDRINAILSLTVRCRKLHAGLVDVADQADAALNAYERIISPPQEARGG